MDNRSRIFSLIATIILVAVVVTWMMTDYISLGDTNNKWPPKRDSEIVLDDEYAEIIDLPRPKNVKAADPSPAFNEDVANNQAEPAPQTGFETVDKGAPGEAPEHVTQTKPSEVKVVKQEQPKQQGPSAEELKKQKEEDEARRKATTMAQSAFRNNGKNNTTNNGKEPGDAGRPLGEASALNGTGTGRVGGGWAMPHYASVPSTVTGSIKVIVKINRSGNVISVNFDGGEAPAATDAKVRAAVEREVRSRKFTRSDNNAPDESTAYITYRFR